MNPRDRRTIFDPTEFDPEMRKDDMASATKKKKRDDTINDQPHDDHSDIDAADSHDPEHEDFLKKIAEIESEREQLKAERDQWKVKSDQARKRLKKKRQAMHDAALEYRDADQHRKDCKAAFDKARTDYIKEADSIADGQELLAFPEENPGANTAAASVGPVGSDEGSLASIDVLLATKIKSIIGKEVFEESKSRDEPLGFTKKGLEIIIGAGWDTIGKLEKAMRDDAHWWEQLKGFGETKRNCLINTLMAFRRVHPHPDDVSTEEAPAAVANDWEQAVSDLDRVADIAGQLVSDGPSEAVDFAKSVGTEAVKMRAGIVDRKSVTDDQLTAIRNWTEGIEKWEPVAK